jgi:hypothetical protein
MSRIFHTMVLTNLVVGFLAYLVTSALWAPLRRGRALRMVGLAAPPPAVAG